MNAQQPVIPIEEQFAIMADNAPVLIWIAGTDKLCYYFNAGWLRFTGRTLEQEYGNGWAEGIHPHDLQRCHHIYVTSFDARQEFKMEYRLRRHDGVYQWLLEHGVPRYTAEGTFAGYIGSCMVIDELLQSEHFQQNYVPNQRLADEQSLNEELQKANQELSNTQTELRRLFGELEISETRYRNEKHRLERFFMQAPAGICILDGPQLVFELINPLYQQFFPGREVLGKPLLKALPELADGPIPGILKEVYDTGKTFEARQMLIPLASAANSAPEDRYFDFIYQARLNEADQVDGILVFVNEVTDTVKQEAIISKQLAKQAQLAAIVSSSDDMIVSKTLEGIITSWNNAAQRMFGYTAEEVIGRHISILIPEEHLPEEDYIIGQIRQGNRVDHFETLRRTKDGRLIPLSLTISPIIDEGGHIIGASKIARDISAQREAQATAERLYEQIKELNDKKDEFIGLASHELKTPLTSIQGYLQILNNDMPEERRKEFVRRAAQQVKKLNNLVSDLLDISKISAGQLQYHMAPFDLCLLVSDAIDLIAAGNTRHRIRFQTDLKALTLTGDQQRIEQVVLNLLTNAIRYAPGSFEIDVHISLEDGMAKVGVRDRGIGIPEDKLQAIFSRFYRVSENKHISGLGLGLYLSQQIIERHQGRIWAESMPGEGSVFYFTLPCNNS